MIKDGTTVIDRNSRTTIIVIVSEYAIFQNTTAVSRICNQASRSFSFSKKAVRNISTTVVDRYHYGTLRLAIGPKQATVNHCGRTITKADRSCNPCFCSKESTKCYRGI